MHILAKFPLTDVFLIYSTNHRSTHLWSKFCPKEILFNFDSWQKNPLKIQFSELKTRISANISGTNYPFILAVIPLQFSNWFYQKLRFHGVIALPSRLRSVPATRKFISHHSFHLVLYSTHLCSILHSCFKEFRSVLFFY